MYKSVPLEMLPEGVVLASPIYNEQQKLLLGAGVEIQQDFMVGLDRRGVRTVVVAEKDWLRLEAFSSKGKAKNALPHRELI